MYFMQGYREQISLYFELKNLPESTQESYLRRIEKFWEYIEQQHKTIEEITTADIHQFIIYLKHERNLSPGTINNYISALKQFNTHCLDGQWNNQKVLRMKRNHSLPVLPPKEDILKLINSTDNFKHLAILSLLYGSGLRVNEVAKLKIRDICSKTMRVRVEHGKHDTFRYTILSHNSLTILRKYFARYFTPNYTPEDWLFPGRKPGSHITIKTIKNLIIKLREKLQLDSRISAHTLRHAFATHSLEQGTDIAYIQQLLGHKSLTTTSIYLHMTSKSFMHISSPLDEQEVE